MVTQKNQLVVRYHNNEENSAYSVIVIQIIKREHKQHAHQRKSSASFEYIQ